MGHDLCVHYASRAHTHTQTHAHTQPHVNSCQCLPQRDSHKRKNWLNVGLMSGGTTSHRPPSVKGHGSPSLAEWKIPPMCSLASCRLVERMLMIKASLQKMLLLQTRNDSFCSCRGSEQTQSSHACGTEMQSTCCQRAPTELLVEFSIVCAMLP